MAALQIAQTVLPARSLLGACAVLCWKGVGPGYRLRELGSSDSGVRKIEALLGETRRHCLAD